MKKITITKAEKFSMTKNSDKVDLIELYGPEEMEASDGYHTFSELYEHRIILWIKLLRLWDSEIQGTGDRIIWRSKLHSDGTTFDGWFILGFGKEKGQQITYHIPLDKWVQCNFAETLAKAPEWDGHTSADVLERIKSLI